ncbi:MAG: DUF1461 domain-containing protein [Gammaproteobacteria bacterium]|nr:DUF1461 domain-containing protein [Gammaproteobacteria bacterium]
MKDKPIVLYHIQWSGVFLSLFIGALFLAWHLLTMTDYLYSSVYNCVGIGENVATFGPQNVVRPHFELTNKQEHIRLFSNIVTAVHNDGAGLEKLTYHTPDGQVLGKFLTDAEIVHLQDVAHLVNVANALGSSALAVALLLLALLWWKNSKPPSLLRYNLRGLLVLLMLVGVILLAGSEKVFYQFHIWLFPEGHQWFFLYQESLMSMFMKAPDLFAYIAVEILIAAIVLYIGILIVINYLWSRPIDQSE